jgi:hypothetical protein
MSNTHLGINTRAPEIIKENIVHYNDQENIRENGTFSQK